MTTVSTNAAMATAFAVMHLAQAQPSSAAQSNALIVVAIVAIIVAVLAGFVRAARALAAMVAAFMQAAAAMTSVMFTVLVIVGYILIHH
jgi:hypothetical protein